MNTTKIQQTIENTQIAFDDSGFTPEILINHVVELSTPKAVPHAGILSKLLSQIEPIDFVDLAGVEDISKLTNAQLKILTIENILSIADRNSWGLCRNQDFIYAFNGRFWSHIELSELRTFLGQAAEKMGMRWDKARDSIFRETLSNQFLESAHFMTPEKKEGILIPLINGTFQINNGNRVLRGFDKDDFLTYQLPFNYDPEAKAPIFQNYLNEVLPDIKKQLVLAEFIGYVFTKGLKLEKALILFGHGANGKSVFFEVTQALLGQNNISNYSLNSLTNGSGYHRAMLANKLVNYASEINGNLEASLFKQLVSGEPIEARLPYGNPMILRDYAKLIFNANALPHDVEHSNAFFRRFLIVPFDVTIKPEDQDIELPKKIINNELPGVFNWVLAGLDRILENKSFTDCDAIRKQLESYRKQSDSVAMFLEDENYQKSINDYLSLKELFQKFKAYCIESGYRPCSIRTLSERLRNLGFESERKRDGNVIYIAKV